VKAAELMTEINSGPLHFDSQGFAWNLKFMGKSKTESWIGQSMVMFKASEMLAT
jgi:hypothetical protein